jgi:hypothetical protein
MFNQLTFDDMPRYAEMPNEFREASIDPAFDAEMEDVQYHLAQYRRTLDQE